MKLIGSGIHLKTDWKHRQPEAGSQHNNTQCWRQEHQGWTVSNRTHQKPDWRYTFVCLLRCRCTKFVWDILLRKHCVFKISSLRENGFHWNPVICLLSRPSSSEGKNAADGMFLQSASVRHLFICEGARGGRPAGPVDELPFIDFH